MKTFKILTLIGVVTFAFYSFTSILQEEWKVPAKYETMKNPIAAKTDAAIGNHCMLNIVNLAMVKKVMVTDQKRKNKMVI